MSLIHEDYSAELQILNALFHGQIKLEIFGILESIVGEDKMPFALGKFDLV